MQPDVICVGQAVMDCITRGREKEPYKKNVYRAQSIVLGTGGDAVNEAVNLSRMGHAVRLVCGVGKDMAGRLIVEEAKRNGIDTGFVTVSEDICTPIANLVVGEDGGRSSINSRATMLGNYIPPEEAVKGARIVSFASLFRAPLDQKETVMKLIRAAKADGAVICADTKLPTYRDIHMRDIQEVLPLIDYLFPNENEAAYYTGGGSYAQMAGELHQLGVKNVIVKTGPKGCVVCGRDGKFEMPSLAVDVVDSSGAGDSFVAGFISALLEKKDLYACCQKGMVCAAQCVRHMGAT